MGNTNLTLQLKINVKEPLIIFLIVRMTSVKYILYTTSYCVKNIIYFFLVKNGKVCTRKSSFAGSFIALLFLEEKCSWIASNTYGAHALSEATCTNWFQRFKCNDFDSRNEVRWWPPKKFEDIELQALLYENDTQSQKQMAEMLNVSQKTISNRLKDLENIQKCGKWVPHEVRGIMCNCLGFM